MMKGLKEQSGPEKEGNPHVVGNKISHLESEKKGTKEICFRTCLELDLGLPASGLVPPLHFQKELYFYAWRYLHLRIQSEFAYEVGELLLVTFFF